MSEIYSIIADATLEAATLLRSGVSPTDAVEKVAISNELTLDSVDRVTEALNTAQMLSVLKKDASERRTEFEVADSTEVKRRLTKKAVKTAEWHGNDPFMDYYAPTLRKKYIPPPTVEVLQKTATATPNQILKQLNSISKVAELAVMELHTTGRELLRKLAEVKPLLPSLHNILAVCSDEPYCGNAMEYLTKVAGVSSLSPPDSLVDSSEFAPFRDFCRLLQKYDALEKVAKDYADLYKTAHEKFKETVYSSMEKDAAGIAPFISSGLWAGRLGQSAMGMRESNLAKRQTGLQSVKELISAVKKARKLQQIVKGDEILREQPPEKVLSAYNMLNAMSGMAATQEPVVRAFLRQAVLHGDTLTGFDVKQYLDLEKGLRELDYINKGKLSPTQQLKNVRGK